MTRHILILVVFFSFLGVVPAQEKTITVQVIIDDEHEEHPGSVYITNSRTNQTTTTDTNGISSLAAAVGDELIFMSEFYEFRRLFITENLIQKQIINVHLNTKAILLDEAKLGFRLTGNLKTDAKNARFVDSAAIVYANLGIQEKDVPPPNPNGQPAGSSKLFVENLIGAITGHNKRQKNLYAYDKQQQKIDEIKDYFGNDFYENNLKIPKEKIDEFVFFVHESSEIYNKVKVNDLLSAEKILTEKSLIYLERINKTVDRP